MTEPSQYFKGRTVQEQMDEVIGYVDKRAGEVAAAKADAVLQPAEEAKTAAQAAAAAAEAAKDTTLAALPAIQQDISGLKTEDTALDGRLDTVELKVQTAEGNIVTIQGQIVSLQNMQADYVKKAGAAQTVTSQIMVPTTATGLRDTQISNGTRIQNDLDAYAAMIRNTGNQTKAGIMTFTSPIVGQMADLAHFGSNTTAGWYAICKLPKQARELYIITYTPSDMNFVLLETNTHTVNVVKWTKYAPNQNRYMWVETNDGMILYVYSATYRTNIISILNYSAYGTPVQLDEIDKSVFTGQPVPKPEVGGDIIAVYDETILNQVTA